MRPTKKIANTHEEEMNLILEFILNFDVQRLLYAINGKELREDTHARKYPNIFGILLAYSYLCRHETTDGRRIL